MNQLTSLTAFSQKPLAVKKQSNSLFLQPLSEKHASAVLLLLTEQVCLPYAASVPNTLNEARAFIRRQGGSAKQRFAIQDSSGDLLGSISYVLSRKPAQPERATISYWIATNNQRQGHAQRAITLLIKHLKKQAIFYLQADVYRSNCASQQLLKKMGFTSKAQEEGTQIIAFQLQLSA